MDTRELFARLIQCEAGGEGTDGMMGVATVVMNRATINYGEFARINGGGDIRSVIEQPGQFTCMKTSVGGAYNPQMLITWCRWKNTMLSPTGRSQAAGWRVWTVRCSFTIHTAVPVRCIFRRRSA